MGERHKHNTKDCRLNSNNRKNGHRNYGPVWDYRRKEEYNRYYEGQYDCRQSVNQRSDLRTYYPSAYRHLNNSEAMWGNMSGTDSASVYYYPTKNYSEEHRSTGYLQHPKSFEPHVQPDYNGLGTASPIQQTNVTWQQQTSRYPHVNKRRHVSDFSCSYNVLESNHKAKKKKPLSQNVPTKREWTIDDAKRAINVEMEFSKRFKRNSLMIKFPDIDINKEIVSKFHTAIENVHFQQPSTARYCFVTLNDHADGDLVIKTLNTTKFGQGYLTAEYKKERDNQIVSPEDIDPLTLYVGNLAQEITKQDLEQIYTQKKRIDIGFAMKMKKTRYAFISFWNVEDSIEAYTRTRSDVLYSKSLIVRFRRLHGTVGLPGEPKLQNPPKCTNIINHTDQRNEDANSSSDEPSSADPRSLADRSDYAEEEDLIDANCEENLIKNISGNSCQASKLNDDYNNTSNKTLKTKVMKVDLSLVKQDPDDIHHDQESNERVQGLKSDAVIESDIKPSRYQFGSPFLPPYVINELMIQHQPIKEELAPFDSPIGQVLPHTEEQKSVQSPKSGSNKPGNENFLEVEMDMVSSVDFISIYKSIQPKPSS